MKNIPWPESICQGAAAPGKALPVRTGNVQKIKKPRKTFTLVPTWTLAKTIRIGKISSGNYVQSCPSTVEVDIGDIGDRQWRYAILLNSLKMKSMKIVIDPENHRKIL